MSKDAKHPVEPPDTTASPTGDDPGTLADPKLPSGTLPASNSMLGIADALADTSPRLQALDDDDDDVLSHAAPAATLDNDDHDAPALDDFEAAETLDEDFQRIQDELHLIGDGPPVMVDPLEHTREIPVLRAEELWFIHDSPPPELSVGQEVVHEDLHIQILNPLESQTYERRDRVAVEGFEKTLLLKQGALHARFVRYELETKLLQQLHDEGRGAGLPHAYHHWTDDNAQYILTDLPPGATFSALLDNAEFSIEDSIRILLDLVDRLEHIHQAGFVMTSLRPTSFTLTSDAHGYRVFLCDFLNLVETLSRPPYPLASPFTAPEVAERSPSDEDVDFYSLGALLFRMISGRDLPQRRRSRVFHTQDPKLRVPLIHQVLVRTLSGPSDRFIELNDLRTALEQLRDELRPQTHVHLALRSSTGLNPMRLINQDSAGYEEVRRIFRSRVRHIGFYCVADGMGGHADGDRASRLAVTGSLERFRDLAAALEHDIWVERNDELCRDIASAGSRKLVDSVKQDGAHKKMGTTFTGVLIVDDVMTMAHIGDSRAILLRDDTMHILSEDHSLVSMMVKAGQMTAEQAERCGEKNILMRSMGGDHVIRPDMFDGLDILRDGMTIKAQHNDRLILVSDGVWSMISRTDMVEIMRRNDNPSALCDDLCIEAIQRGGVDNVVVLALFFERAPSYFKLLLEASQDTLESPLT